MKLKNIVTIAAVICAAGSLTASALILPPGGFLNPPLDEGKPVGAVLLAQLPGQPYVGADIQGTLTSSVYIDDVSNPFGGLTFTYEINADFGSLAPVESFTVGNYGPFLTDVSYNLFGVGAPIVPPGPVVAPVYAGRTFNGNVISFDFSLFGNPGITPGESSALLVVQTDVLRYSTTVASVINAGSAEVLSFAPEAVPEPATLAMIGLFSGGILFMRRYQFL